MACAAARAPPVIRQQGIGGRRGLVVSLPRRSTIVASASPSTSAQPAQEQDPPKPRSFARSAWAFVDVLAIFGSVGGAVCALLGIGTTAYVLALPMVLPVVSLIAALSREGLIAEDNARQYDRISSSLQGDSHKLLQDARAAVEEVRRELKTQAAAAGRLSSLESRLSSLEGSILSAGRSAREAASGLASVPELLSREQRLLGDSLVATMRSELRRSGGEWAAEEAAMLARLETRLAAVEGSLSGLEVAQGEGIRRLGMSISAALSDAEAALQVSVRSEVALSMDPVRRLPQLLAAYLPPTPTATKSGEWMDASTGDESGGTVGGVGELQLRAAVQEAVQVEVDAALAKILAAQADGFARLAQAKPTPLDEEQWEALGKRLSRLEAQVQAIPAASEVAMKAAVSSGLAPRLSEAAAGMREEAAAAAAREVDSLRGEVAASRAAVTESLQGGLEQLSLMLAPLRDGLAGLQDAADAQAAADAGRSFSLGSTPQAASVNAALSAELARVAEAVGKLDARLEAVAAAGGAGDGGGGDVTALASQLSDMQRALAAIEGQLAASPGVEELATAAAKAAASSVVKAAAAAALSASSAATSAANSAASAAVATSGSASASVARGRRDPPGFGSSDEEGAPGQYDGTMGSGALVNGPASFGTGVVEEPGYPASFPADDATSVPPGATTVPRGATTAGQPGHGAGGGAGSSGSSGGSGRGAATADDGSGRARQQQQQSQEAANSGESSAGSSPSTSGADARGAWSGSDSQSDSGSEPESSARDVNGSGRPDEFSARDVSGRPLGERLAEGLRLLRLGREEARTGQDLGLADRALREAVSVLRDAVETAPEDPKALGNLGNVLLAQGELKRAYLEMLASGPPPESPDEASVQASAEAAVAAEAASLLTRAGEMFKKVLEVEGWSSRALVNWGRAMCLRAELADSPELASRLYSAALDKFEAVLETEPGMVTAQYRAALAMQGLALLATTSGEAAPMLQRAAEYLRGVLTTGGAEAEGLAGAATDALRRTEAELAAMAQQQQQR